MTTPLNTDALSKIVKAGATPVMLTEYMPGGTGAQLINTASTGTVYAGTSSSVQPSTGVPIPAGASVQWIKDGQLWLIAGPDVTTPVTIIASALVSAWAPSPEVVGAIIAAQLLLTGIPNVLTETVIGDFVLPPTGSGVLVNVTGYASITLIELDNPGSNRVAMGYNFTDLAFTAVIGSDQWTNQVGAPAPVTIPVLGPILSLGISADDPASTHTVRIIGSNRPAPSQHPTTIGYSSTGFEAVLSTTMVAGTTYALPVVHGNIFQGPAVVEASIVGNTVKGNWVLTWETGQGALAQNIADTSEAHLIGTDQHLYKTTAFPGVRYTLNFTCTTGSAGAFVVLRAIPAY